MKFPANRQENHSSDHVFTQPGSYPDSCDTGHPHLEGKNVPAVRGAGKDYVANEAYCNTPGAARREGNLPASAPQGVHSADDVSLTASGPGAPAM